MVVVRVPEHLPNGGGVGGVADEGVRRVGGRALEHRASVHAHQHHLLVVRAEGHARPDACVRRRRWKVQNRKVKRERE